MSMFNLTPTPIPDDTAPFVFGPDDSFTWDAGDGYVLTGTFYQTRSGGWHWGGSSTRNDEPDVFDKDGGPADSREAARAAVVAWGRGKL